MPIRAPTLLLCFSLSAGAAAHAAPAVAVDVTRADAADGGKQYRIAASATVAAPPAAVWRVLTDYDHLADFVPDLDSARVLARDGSDAIVEQRGAARFLFFRQPIRLVVRVHEQTPDAIDVALVEGDMQAYDCHWRLAPAAGGGTRVTYEAALAPKFYVPAMIGTSLVRNDIAKMMKAVLARAEREK